MVPALDVSFVRDAYELRRILELSAGQLGHRARPQ